MSDVISQPAATLSGPQLVACPRPFAQAEQVALAFAEVGALSAYLTGFVWDREGLMARMISPALRGRLGRRVRAALERRELDHLDGLPVRSLPTVDLGRSAAELMGLRGLADLIWERDDWRFARAAGRRFLGDCRGVHGFEHSSLELFDAARREGRRCALHFSSAHPKFKDRILDAEFARFPSLKGASAWKLRERRDRRDRRREREFEAADVILCVSNFSARTLTSEGVPADRVAVVALGAPPLPCHPPTELAPANRPLTFLYAGAVAVHKGCHILLEAWRRAALKGARLLLAGRNELPPELGTVEGVEFLGQVDPSRLCELMREADLFVFPSLCDSFGLVVAEALSQGLPVLCTLNAGAADMIRPGVNGWLIDAGETAPIEGRLAWCGDHPDDLRAMRASTIEGVGALRTWSNFRADMRTTLAERGF